MICKIILASYLINFGEIGAWWSRKGPLFDFEAGGWIVGRIPVRVPPLLTFRVQKLE